MQLVELLNKANSVYPDNYLSEYFDDKTGEPTTPIAGDTLAKFIVAELRETFDPNATDEQQHEVGRQVLNRAGDTLYEVSIALGTD
jgi:hypothetical protein